MRRCIVSMTGRDSQEHQLETDATSLFDAAYAGIDKWCRLWWYDPDCVITVRAAGEEEWRVVASRVSVWHAEMRRAGLRPPRGRTV
jgi:hypothetical protein